LDMIRAEKPAQYTTTVRLLLLCRRRLEPGRTMCVCWVLAPFRDCTAPVGLTVRQKWGFSRGDAGGGTPSEGVWGNAPSWRGRGSTLYRTLNFSWHKPDCRDRIELAPNAPAPERNAAVAPCPSCKTMPCAGSVGSVASPHAPPSRP